MEERPDAPANARGLSDTFADDAVAYRPVSVLAVLGAVLGLASLIALASGWFAPLSVVAAVISLLAAKRIQNNPDAQSGFGVAVFGLVVSLLVAGAVAVQQPTAGWLHAKASGAVADRFLEGLGEGDLVTAFELTRPYADRRPGPELAKIFYESDARAKERLDEFSSRPGVQRLSGAGTPKRVKHLGAGRVRGTRFNSVWIYRLPATSDGPEQDIRVRLERPATRRLESAWRVDDFELTEFTD